MRGLGRLVLVKVSKISSHKKLPYIFIPKVIAKEGFEKGRRVAIYFDKIKKRIVIKLLEE